MRKRAVKTSQGRRQHCESPRDKQNDGNKHSLPQLLLSFRLSPIDLLKTSKCAFWINPLILLCVTGSGGNDSGQWLEGFSAQIERLSILKGSHAAVKAGAEGSIIVFSTDLLRGDANPTCAVDQSKFEIADGNTTVSRKF